jgi:hypothetical protein
MDVFVQASLVEGEFWGDMASPGVSDQRAYVAALYWSSMTLTTIGCAAQNCNDCVMARHLTASSASHASLLLRHFRLHC